MIVLALICLLMVVSSLYLRWRIGKSVAYLLLTCVPLSILSVAAGVSQEFMDSTSLQWLDLHVGCAVTALLSLTLDRQYCADFLASRLVDQLGPRSEGHAQTFFERHLGFVDGVFRGLLFLFLGLLVIILWLAHQVAHHSA
jgi:hypothetical protein